MKRSDVRTELLRLGAPITGALDAAWRRMHWWLIALALLYAFSGITVIRPDEVGIVLRWGRLVGNTPATQQHGPGLLFALPRPIDRVIRVRTRTVRELRVDLAPPANSPVDADTLDPITVGYAVTGDENIVHVKLIARYRVRDPAVWAFYAPRSDAIVRAEVKAATVRSVGEMSVDQVLAERRKQLVQRITRRSQAGLDAAHSGLELVSLELTDLEPPRALAGAFEAVQSAYIDSETERKEAEAFAQDLLPRARAVANAEVQSAQGAAAAALARARGEADAFRALDRQYRANPAVVRERLYRNAIDQAIGAAGDLRWIPPLARQHQRMRILVSPTLAKAPSSKANASSSENDQ